jgi:hypothetical protein
MDDEDWEALIRYMSGNNRDFRDFLRDQFGNAREPNARARSILNALHELRERSLKSSGEETPAAT